MKLKRILCIVSLMLMVFLVGCGEKKLDLADLQYDWQFVEMEAAGETTPHTPGLEYYEPSIEFDGSTMVFSMKGSNDVGKVEAGTENYKITYPDNSRKPMTAELSDGGNTLTVSVDGYSMYFIFTKN